MSEFSSTCQPPSGPSRTKTSGTTGVHRLGAEGQAGLGLERADFRDHVGDVFGIDAAERAQLRHVAARDRDRAGSAASASPDRAGRLAFSCSARHSARSRAPTPTGSKPCTHAQHRLDIFELGAQALGDIGRGRRADSRPRRPHRSAPAQIRRSSGIERGDGQLVFQMILERGCARQRAIPSPSSSPSKAAAGFHRGPVGQRRWRLAGGAGAQPRRRHTYCRCAGWSSRSTLEKSSRASAVIERARMAPVGARHRLRARRRGAVVALQQRIAFQLCSQYSASSMIRQLQQLDRLLQLRRHDQGLALPDFKSLPQPAMCCSSLYSENFSPR